MEERSASQVRQEAERASQKAPPARSTPQKKRVSVDNRRVIGPVAKAVAAHSSGGGMRKSQSATQLNIAVEGEIGVH